MTDCIITLNDLKEMVNHKKNPSIFILSDMKSYKQTDEAFPPSNIIIDNNGDIIIQIDEKLLQ